jgi:hypothetical protein
MRPVIIDQDTGRELWRAQQCAEHIGAAPVTWRGYVSRGQAPAPVAELDARTPLWDADDVRDWHTARPRPGGHTDGKQ